MRFLLLALALAVSSTSAYAQAGTVIVANMSDDTATIIDAYSGRVMATLPTGPSPHEVAVSEDGRTAVITNYGNRSLPGNSLTVIDLPSLSVRSTVSTGIYSRPHGVAFLPGGLDVVFTAETDSAVVIMNLETEEIEGTVPTFGHISHMLSMDPTGRHLYTTNILSGTISHIDAVARTHRKVIDVAPFVEGLAVSPSGSHVWVGSNRRKTVSIVDTAEGVVVDSLTGFGFPYRMAVTPNGATTVISDPQAGEVRLVDARTFQGQKRVLFPDITPVDTAEIPGSVAPEGLVISPDSRFAYISLQGANRMAILDLSSGNLVRTVETGTWPDGIGYSPLVIEK